MDGYTTWKLHRAVSFHLLKPAYDLFEHKGRTKNSSKEDFEKRNDQKIFNFIGGRMDKPNDAVQFFTANILYTGKDSVHELASAWENYVLFVGRKQALTKLISDDIERLSFPDDLQSDNGTPKLLRELIGRRIIPETAIAINKVHPFVDEWIERSYFGISNWAVIIKKAPRLIGTYNNLAIEKLIQEHETV